MFQRKPVIVLFMLLISCALFLFGLSNAPSALAAPAATTWYVNAASGDDGDSCLSQAAACQTVGGAVAKAASGDTIQISTGTYIEHLDVSLDLTFVGAGKEHTFLDGGNSGRVFIAASANISISDLTIQNGYVTGSGVGKKGAGIYNYNTLVLDNVRVTQNSTQDGGAGIFSSGRLLIQNSEVISNTTDGSGGGIEIWSTGVVTLTNSLVGWNEAGTGGGIFNSGQLFAENSSLRGNRSGISGGGLVSFNEAALEGVAVYENQTDGYGAGLLNELGSMSLLNVTVSGNSAPNYVGVANINDGAVLTITNSTIAENTVTATGTRYGGVVNLYGTATLRNTIVANNDSRQCSASGTWTSLGNNLASDNYCAFTQPGDLQFVDPGLAPLADYNGPTVTHALVPGSLAIDGGSNTGCPAVDQRGVARPFDGDNDSVAVCDIGAFEAENQITINDVTLTEGDAGTTNAVFTVTLAPTSTQSITVDYVAVNQTAIAGSDYQATSGELTFDPGESTQQISVPVIGDTSDEADETFTVSLSQPVNADILDGQGTGTIVDDDGLPSLTIADVSVSEGNSGTVNASFVVTLSPADSQTITVDFATANGSATAGSDFITASGTLTFAPGDTTKTILVAVTGDSIDEGTSETFSVLLSDAINATLVDDDATATILDDEISTISLNNGDPVLEGDSGTKSMIFTVTLSSPTSFPVSVDYYTQGGVSGNFATTGVDYEETSGTLSFSPGETLKTFSVTIYGDIFDEPEQENFSVFLTNASPISIYGSASSGYIQDDDLARLYLPMSTK